MTFGARSKGPNQDLEIKVRFRRLLGGSSTWDFGHGKKHCWGVLVVDGKRSFRKTDAAKSEHRQAPPQFPPSNPAKGVPERTVPRFHRAPFLLSKSPQKTHPKEAFPKVMLPAEKREYWVKNRSPKWLDLVNGKDYNLPSVSWWFNLDPHPYGCFSF